MDPVLLALLEDMARRAAKAGTSDCVEVKFAALDALDYLGKQIDAERVQRKELSGGR